MSGCFSLLGIILPDHAQSLPHTFDSTFLDRFAANIWKNLSTADHDNIRRCVSLLSTVRWGSGCSGTDAPAWAFAALKDAFAAAGIALKTCHVYSAELVDFKRKFISKVPFGRPQFLFKDLFDLSRSSARCTLSGESTNPLRLLIDVFICGFSCKSASFLNHHETGAVASAGDGSTAITFRGVLCVLQRTKPVLGVFENVQGLLLSQQLQWCVGRIESLGYAVCWKLMSPSDYGLPQIRQRVYIMCMHTSRLRPATTSAVLQAAADELFDRSMSSHPRVGVNTFLLPNSHPLILTRQRSFLERSSGADRTAEVVDCKWVYKHRTLGLHSPSTHWRTDCAAACPEYGILGPRVLELFDAYDVCFRPEQPSHRILNMSQTTCSAAIDNFPTITPQGFFWSEDLCRSVSGYERLRAQLIWADDALVTGFTDRELADLAGNAFSNGNCVPVLICLLCLFGQFASGVPCIADVMPVGHKRRRTETRSSRPARVIPSPSRDMDHLSGWLDVLP